MHKIINSIQKGTNQMIWKILIVFSVLNSIFLYLIILGASKCRTPEEQEEEDYMQMLALKNLKKQKGKKKNEKTNNSGETECFEIIGQNIERWYKE